MEERPSELTRRNRPVPAPDSNVDPVDTMMMPAAEPVAPAKKKKTQEIVISFSTRLSQEAYDMLYRAVDEEGLTVRKATEEAILAHWGRKQAGR